VVLAWCYSRFLVVQRLPRPAGLGGLVFGVGAWVALIPASAVASVLRLTGFHQAHSTSSTVVELGVAVLTGYLIGHGARLGRSGVLATMAAAFVLLAVQAGPIPVVNGWRSLGLLVLLAPLYALCGLVQALQTAWLVHQPRSQPSPTAV
jgi:ABC-type glycerol-3-phosphate transport system permease component